MSNRAAKAMGWSWPALLAAAILLPLAVYFFDFVRAPRQTLALMFAPAGEAARLGFLLGRTTSLAALAATISLMAALIVFAAAEPALAKRKLWPFAFMLPLLVPGHFVAVAWIQWLGFAGTLTHWLGAGAWLPYALYSLPGVAAVMGLKLYPLALGFVYIGWRSAGTSAVEAASVLMPPAALWRRFVLGWMRPWLAAAWLIVFLTALLDYSIPLLMRMHVFSVEIMSAFNVYYKPELAMAMALPLMAMSLAGAAALGLILSRVNWPVLSRRPCRLPLLQGPWRCAFSIGAGAVAAGSFILPTLFLLKMSNDLGAFAHVIASARDQIATSLAWSAVATAAVIAMAAGLATRGLWNGSKLRTLAASLMLLLYALPGSVVAMAFINFYNRPALGRLYDCGAMLPLGLATVNLPIAWIIFHVRLREIPATLIEVNAIAPIAPARRFWQLVAPTLARPALLAAAVTFILAMNEVQAAMLLVAPGQETMSVRAMTLLHYAPDRLVAAFCLTAWAVALVPVAALAALGKAAGHLRGKLVPHHELD
ncbi:MAG: hypothetical protein ABFD69_07840 [Candidatus Sumerlaeia bacterium]